MRPDLISLIVATYNWPAALDRVLEALSRQTWRKAEVIVADDGSRPATGELAASWQGRLGLPLIHAWQEDEGFRLSRVRNLAASRASGDYLVFIDGDCIAPPTFLEDHAALARRGWFTGGRRAFLTPEATAQILSGTLDPAAATPRHFIKRSHAGRLKRLPLGPIRRLRPLTWKQVEGCNMAVWRDDFLSVGGFDEAFREYGHEDVDFALRLMRSGLKGVWATNAATLLHLDHGRGTVGAGSDAALKRIFAEERTLPARSMFTEAAA
ncbi:MAG TPA: glycosyltransferase family 2 protein [Caulobacteraceae bacterium]|nr:glycosyltransferase family 2 protein [Caulobacteraceae bacterium]